jgi:hypothetical protein
MELHKLALSDDQKRKLIRGHAVQVRHANIGIGGSIMLDKKQSTKIHKAMRTGSGVRIQLHNEDLVRNNVMHGTGFKQFLSKARSKLIGFDQKMSKNSAYRAVKNVGKTVAKKYANDAIDVAKQIAKDYVADQVGDSMMGDIVKSGANQYIDQQGNQAKQSVNGKINGLGIGKTERALIRGFNTVGKVAKTAVKSKVGKSVLKGVAKVAIPAVLAGITAETGIPAIALAPTLTNVANKQIDGLGFKKPVTRKATRSYGRKKSQVIGYGGALVPSGY